MELWGINGKSGAMCVCVCVGDGEGGGEMGGRGRGRRVRVHGVVGGRERRMEGKGM